MGNIEKFDSIAGQYDTTERIEIANLIAAKLGCYISGSQLQTAVDYGCGTGLVGLRLLDKFASMLFIDASINMINEVNQKIAAGKIENARTLCCDIAKEQPLGLQADCIMVVQVLLHEKDTVALLTCLRGMLKPGGQLLIVDFDKNENISSDAVHNGFEQQELADVLRGLSFSHIESETFYEGKGIFMNQDASLFILSAINRAA